MENRKNKVSDKEKLMAILKNHEKGSFEDFLFSYLRIYEKDFSPERMVSIVNRINNEHLYPKMLDLEHTRRVAKEHAYYLKTFLDGNMYTSEEAAKQNLPCQVKNAQRILDACDGKKDEFGVF